MKTGETGLPTSVGCSCAIHHAHVKCEERTAFPTAGSASRSGSLSYCSCPRSCSTSCLVLYYKEIGSSALLPVRAQCQTSPPLYFTTKDTSTCSPWLRISISCKTVHSFRWPSTLETTLRWRTSRCLLMNNVLFPVCPPKSCHGSQALASASYAQLPILRTAISQVLHASLDYWHATALPSSLDTSTQSTFLKGIFRVETWRRTSLLPDNKKCRFRCNHEPEPGGM